MALALSRWFSADSQWLMGRLDAAVFRSAYDGTEALGTALLGLLATRGTDASDLAEAREGLRTCMGEDSVGAVLWAVRARTAAAIGDGEAAQRAIDRALLGLGTLSGASRRATILWVAGAMLCVGRVHEAMEAYENAMLGAEGIALAHGLTGYAAALAEQGRITEAEEHCLRATRLAGQHGASFLLAMSALSSAVCAHVMGHRATAAGRFGDAVVHAERAHWRACSAVAWTALGAVRLAANERLGARIALEAGADASRVPFWVA